MEKNKIDENTKGVIIMLLATVEESLSMSIRQRLIKMMAISAAIIAIGASYGFVLLGGTSMLPMIHQ